METLTVNGIGGADNFAVCRSGGCRDDNGDREPERLRRERHLHLLRGVGRIAVGRSTCTAVPARTSLQAERGQHLKRDGRERGNIAGLGDGVGFSLKRCPAGRPSTPSTSRATATGAGSAIGGGA